MATDLDEKALIEWIVREVAELPDRTSPEGEPEAMLVTADELGTIIREGLNAARAKALPEDVALFIRLLRTPIAGRTIDTVDEGLLACANEDRLQAATLIESLARGQEWQPIEKAPRDIGTDILLTNGRDFAIGGWSACNEWQDDGGWPIEFEPTDWKPLTPPQPRSGVR